MREWWKKLGKTHFCKKISISEITHVIQTKDKLLISKSSGGIHVNKSEEKYALLYVK